MFFAQGRCTNVFNHQVLLCRRRDTSFLCVLFRSYRVNVSCCLHDSVFMTVSPCPCNVDAALSTYGLCYHLHPIMYVFSYGVFSLGIGSSQWQCRLSFPHRTGQAQVSPECYDVLIDTLLKELFVQDTCRTCYL